MIPVPLTTAWYLVSAAVVFVTLELLVRLATRKRIHSLRGSTDFKPPVIPSINPIVKYDFAPESVLANTLGCKRIRINNLGFRGDDCSKGKRAHTKRVVCIGDSITFGNYSEDRGTYPSLLQDQLEHASGDFAMAEFEVINGGRPSYHSQHILTMLVYRCLELCPDYLVCCAGWNDIPAAIAPPFAPHGLIAVRRLITQCVSLSIYVRSFLVFAVLLKLARALLEQTIHRTVHQKDNATNLDGIDRLVRTLGVIADICAPRGITPIVLGCPHFLCSSPSGPDREKMREHLNSYQLDYGGWRRLLVSINKSIEDSCASRNITYVSLDGMNSSMFIDICHLNELGNSFVAQRVCSAILAAEKKLP